MHLSVKTYAASICLICAMGTPVLAQQPPDPVKSDALANTAVGTDALLNVNLDESGCHNTATGEEALYSDTSGSYNTATGFSALHSNVTGSNNTAAGYESLEANTTGGNNTASGYQSLYGNTTGEDNTAGGFKALLSNTTGAKNTAIGANALQANTVGRENTAQGYEALHDNSTGSNNTAVGNFALYENLHGSFNTAIGYKAGEKSSGTDNIYIANAGVPGESQTLRLGTAGSAGASGSGITSAYIAGVVNSKVTGSAVYINANGQLGVLASAERYKTDVQTMGSSSERLAALRPVTFKLKGDPEGQVQYGLIAEEVAKVLPELVTRGADGKIEGVRYEELAPMLLNELQEQQRRFAAQEAEIRELKQTQQQLLAAVTAIQSANQLVAQR